MGGRLFSEPLNESRSTAVSKVELSIFGGTTNVAAIEDPEWTTWLKPADIRILTDDELDSIAGRCTLRHGPR